MELLKILLIVLTLVMIYVVNRVVRLIWFWPGRPKSVTSKSIPQYTHPQLSLIDKILNYMFPILLPVGEMITGESTSIARIRRAFNDSICLDSFTLKKMKYKMEPVTVGDDKNSENKVDVVMLVPEDLEEASSKKKKKKLVVWIHGGGLVLGDTGNDRNLIMQMSLGDNKPVVCSVSYRLAPEHTFPAASDDVETVLNHFCARKDMEEKYKYKNVLVAGISAGGYLAVVSSKNYLEKNNSNCNKISGIIAIDTMMMTNSFHKSRCRNAWTRACPVEWLDWCWKVYQGDSPEEELMCGCLDKQTWGKLKDSSWNGTVLMSSSRADPMLDAQIELLAAIRDGLGKDRVTDFFMNSSHALGWLDKANHKKFQAKINEMMVS